MTYLDPKNDLTFKKIFGEHPEILMDFLNAILPLPTNQQIIELSYLQAEQTPVIPLFKNSIVDVKCVDSIGRIFIVEMQMLWTDSFANRVVFNASKALVKQLEKGEEYRNLQPVYALSLVNQNYDNNTTEYLHHYKIVNVENKNMTLNGLEFVFVELPKIKTENLPTDVRKRAWLRFFTEIKDHSTIIHQEIKNNPETLKALDLLQESAFNEEELESYDKHWDNVSIEKTILGDAKRSGINEGIEQGEFKKNLELAKNFKSLGVDIQKISKATGLSINEIEKL
jgi:predicted transposase/invertase (TIGR01784 family)